MFNGAHWRPGRTTATVFSCDIAGIPDSPVRLVNNYTAAAAIVFKRRGLTGSWVGTDNAASGIGIPDVSVAIEGYIVRPRPRRLFFGVFHINVFNDLGFFERV